MCIVPFLRAFLPVLAIFVMSAIPALCAVVTFDRPGMDVWMYENGYDRGYRENAPTFAGPVGVNNGSDDRLGQMVMGWNTSSAGTASIPKGLALSQYQITRVTLKVTNINGQFEYDPTYDGFATYLPANNPAYVVDEDSGRPIELHGLGLRNGYTELALSGSVSGTRFGEATSSFGSGVGEHTRHAFAWSPDSPRGDGDVSENVSEGFEATPFAIGMNADLFAGELVPADAEFTFELNLSHPAILQYLREALQEGVLGLTLSSLHGASYNGQPGAQVYPRFYTGDYYNIVDFVVPQLEIEYSIVPEPNVGSALIVATALLAAGRSWRRRDRFT